ncbi:MAG TPA: hypothetical protein PKW94_01410 [Candidatus Dojkabacteria bacterium]|nr:hypothetical protein [Candidatus Dojkabacteria bacterium]HOF79029.1 hypothetical protein [Candidatus Dojkabacteria bacterium]HOR06069.1 hypothetical protein [Candidatus Dojkabacteria bacterium]HOT60941.1 hypothetical protein [Candidatus Dojkabacteria bacterium]HQI92661.1 hypothetical protein [Candidatus Dojkabacteria bacterium]
MANLIKKNVKEEKIKKEIEAVSEKIQKTRLTFTDILVPIVAVIVLVVLGIFVFIPMIKEALAVRNEYVDVKAKEKQLEQLEIALNNLDETTLQADLVNAKNVIPKTLKVSSFIYYIDNLAFEKNLSSEKISAGDIKIGGGEKKEGKYILGVSGPLAYSGSLENILSFLESLYSASPYIISVENISLSESSKDWTVELNVTGYYVPENIDEFNLYSKFEPYTTDDNVVKIFESKAKELD